MPVGNLDRIIDRIHRLKRDSGSEIANDNLLNRSVDSALSNNRPNRSLMTGNWKFACVQRISKVKSLSHRNAPVRASGGRSKWRGQVWKTEPDSPLSESDLSGSVDPQLSHLESLECFAAHFRRKRIMLGYTQQQVGDTLGRRYNAYFSQTTISRFEDLNLSVRNMSKLRPLIQRWIVDTERAMENGTASIDVESEREDIACNGSLGRRRRKRTTIDDRMKSYLENVFKTTPRPSTIQIEELASQLSLRAEVVRVWFCNRRQREARSTTASSDANGSSAHGGKANASAGDQSGINEPPMLQPYFVAGGNVGSSPSFMMAVQPESRVNIKEESIADDQQQQQHQLKVECQVSVKVESDCMV